MFKIVEYIPHVKECTVMAFWYVNLARMNYSPKNSIFSLLPARVVYIIFSQDSWMIEGKHWPFCGIHIPSLCYSVEHYLDSAV